MCSGDGLALACYLLSEERYALELSVSIPTLGVGKHPTKNARIPEASMFEYRSLGLAQNRITRRTKNLNGATGGAGKPVRQQSPAWRVTAIP
jgi:hypothetical protein